MKKIIKRKPLSQQTQEDLGVRSEKDMNDLLGPLKESDLENEEAISRAIDEHMQDPAMQDAALPDPNGPSFDDIMAELTGGKKPIKEKKRGSEGREPTKKLPPMR